MVSIMDDQCNVHECAFIQRLESQIDDLRKTNSETHQKLWVAINELKTNDAVQDSKYDTILSQLNSVVNEVKALQAVPGDHWKDFTKTVFASVITLIIGYIFGKLGII